MMTFATVFLNSFFFTSYGRRSAPDSISLAIHGSTATLSSPRNASEEKARWKLGHLGHLHSSDGRILSWSGSFPFKGEWKLQEVAGAVSVEAGRDENIRAALMCREPVNDEGHAAALLCKEDDVDKRLRVAFTGDTTALAYNGEAKAEGLFTPCEACPKNGIGACAAWDDSCGVCMCSCEEMPGLCREVDSYLSREKLQGGRAGDCGSRVLEWAKEQEPHGYTQMLGCQRTAEALLAQLMLAHGEEKKITVAPATSDWHKTMADRVMESDRSSVVLVLVSVNPQKGSAQHALVLETFEDDHVRVYNSWVSGFSLTQWLDQDLKVGVPYKIPNSDFGRGQKLSRSGLENYFAGVFQAVRVNDPSLLRFAPKDCSP